MKLANLAQLVLSLTLLGFGGEYLLTGMGYSLVGLALLIDLYANRGG